MGLIVSSRLRHCSGSPSRTNPKVALDAGTRLCGHLLDTVVGQVGNVRCGLGIRISLSVDQRSFCGQAHRPFTLESPSFEGHDRVSCRKSPRRCGCAPRNQHRFESQTVDVGERCGRNVRFSYVCGRSIFPVGHLSQISVWRVFWPQRPSLWSGPWLLLIPASVL